MIRIVACAALAGSVLFGVPKSGAAQEEPDSTPASTGIEGRWEGLLGGRLRLVVDIIRTRDGLLFGTFTSVDQGGTELSIDRIDLSGDSVRFEIDAIRGSYAAVLTDQGSRLVGTWTQGREQRLSFTRVTRPAPPEPEPNAYSLFGVAADLRVPVPPVPFTGDGKRHLAYEIQVRNHSGDNVLITELEVRNRGTPVAHWEGNALHQILGQRGPNVRDKRAIPAGGWSIAYVWVTLDSGTSVPAALRHRLTFGDQVLEGIVPVMNQTTTILGPPLRGGPWYAANGPSNSAGHRRALVPVDGEAFIAQRYAIDWAKIGDNGQAFEGDQSDNEAYFGYGEEVLAVGDAVVEAVRDGIAENAAGSSTLSEASEGDTLRAVAMSLETIAGNYVILSLGDGRYALYGHLQPGSVTVQPGDRVERGEVIGRLGNSGNSTAPHLHFHLSDRPHPLAAEGLPYEIDAWNVRTADGWKDRTGEIPMQGALVRFPMN